LIWCFERSRLDELRQRDRSVRECDRSKCVTRAGRSEGLTWSDGRHGESAHSADHYFHARTNWGSHTVALFHSKIEQENGPPV
jgi:hypothetical protein